MNLLLSYDPSSLGLSEGDMDTVELSDWVEDAATVLETLGSKENIIVASSMGGWIGLWLASQKQLADKISGLVLVAPAVNFLRPHYQQVYSNLPSQDQQRLDRGEVKYFLLNYFLKYFLPRLSALAGTRTEIWP